MSSAYDKLRRILSLEREQGCRNRAVIGGFARFLTYWEKEAKREAPKEQLADIDQIVTLLGGYAELSPEMRVETIQRILELLDRELPDPSQKRQEPEAGATASPPVGDVRVEQPAEAVVAPAPRAAAQTAPQESAPEQAPEGPGLDAPVTALKGISEINQKRLARLGIETIEDLLYHLPRRYDDYGHLKTINRLALGDEVTVVGIIQKVTTQTTRSGKSVVRLTIHDGTAPIEATWFNQPYLAKRFRAGREIVLSGTVDEYLGRLVFNAPEWEPLQRELLHTGRLVPVYPLTARLSGRWLRRMIRSALEIWVPRIQDPLPPALRQAYDLMDLGTALHQIHFPDDQASLAAARRRLCFDEFLLLQLGILRHRAHRQAQRARVLEIPEQEIADYIASLPFALTAAQQRAVRQILDDLAKPLPMSRLLQGDVGSGKTVVAVIAALAVVRNGLQVAIMAPTAILAEQHYRTFEQLLGKRQHVRCALLTGDLTPLEKRDIQEEIANGRVQVVVGTHALIQEAVNFARLGLVVVDEQHRFGVAQRGALRAKAGELQPHLLAMSATPIPRTLALTVYGDLDISILDEMPPGRQEIVTAVRTHHSRERIYAFIRSQIEQGRQAFVICPLVEESVRLEATAAVAEYERLQSEVFPQFRVGLLHGRMSAEEKERAMAAFAAGDTDILVSTAVVEVGIDVPNATVMLIEGADRFGLAQLHQFRGRVGRGEHQSYCILLSDDPSENGLERLRIMEETNDGFVLAEKDLEMRGPGDFFGVRQHGLPPLRVAKLSDTIILDQARRAAGEILKRDPELAAPEHRLLAERVDSFWRLAELS